MNRLVAGFMALLFISQSYAGTIYDELQSSERARLEDQAERAQERALVWLMVGLGAFGMDLHYGRLAHKAERNAREFRDRAGSHDGVVYTTYGRRPEPPKPEPIVIDLGPARNMEIRADKYRDKALFFFGLSMVCATIGGLNFNQSLKFRADARNIGVSLERKF